MRMNAVVKPQIQDQVVVDHEIKIRILEKMSKDIEMRFDKMEAKMDTQFTWLMGTILSMFGGIVLHLAKLI